MKRFDSESIYNRTKQRLEMMNEWSQIIPNGTISSLLKTWAEMGNEFSRYLEYLYQEKKFKNARNLSSVAHLTDLVGYKRSLPRSAIGYIIVSHTDKDGKNRLANFGTDFFDLDAASDYDELTQKRKGVTDEEKAALVPWTANKSYVIPEGTVVTSASGIKYVTTETVESRSLKEPFSVIKKDPVKYAAFVEAGGWNGIKYLKVPVIQGEPMTTTIGQATGARYETFTLGTLDVENGSNILSSKFFNLDVRPEGAGDEEATTWHKVDSVGLAGPYDRVFEVEILSDRLLFKFGNGITGRLLPQGAIITVHYLKTLGENGNITSKYQLNTLSLSCVDPRTNELADFLCCTNVVPISGGRPLEDVADLKESAPVDYLKSYTVSSRRSYLKQIDEEAPCNLLHPHVYFSDSVVTKTEAYGPADDAGSNDYLSSVDGPTGVKQEITAAKRPIVITALRSNGEEFEDPDAELIEPLTEVLDDYMSPSDQLSFMKPNIIKLCPRITVGTSSSILESDIIDDLRPRISAACSVFSRDFQQPFFKSNIIDITHNLSYTKKVDCFLEAKATVDMEPTIITKAARSGIAWLDKIGNGYVKNVVDLDPSAEAAESLFAFNFSFDKIFAQNKLEAGFKNYKYSAPYLLKIDVIFLDRAENSRTLFLFDDRVDLATKKQISIMEAYETALDAEIPMPPLTNDGFSTYGPKEDILWRDPNSEYFQNVQARTAQFPRIEAITDTAYVDQARSFMHNPFEIRPLFIDEYGKNAIFDVADIPEGERVSFSYDSEVVTTECFRKNFQYWPHTKIEFYENYDNPDSVDYARGRLIVPINKILTAKDVASLKALLENVVSFDEQTPEIKRLIKDRIVINVFAVPVQTTFECGKQNDLICVGSDEEDVMIEKKTLI